MSRLFWLSFVVGLAATLCAWNGVSYATEYFVDSLRGDDQASGESPEQAWKSLDRVNGKTFEPGDVVRFRRGRVWRGSLRCHGGTPEAPVVYSDYGEGAKPRVLNSVDLTDPNLWEPTDDPNIWATKPNDCVELEKTSLEVQKFAQGKWHVYTEEDAEATCRATTFEELGGASGYVVDCEEPGSVGTYLQFTTERFPVRFGKAFAFHFRARATAPVAIDPGCARVFMTNKPWTGYGETLSAPKEIGTEWKEYTLVFRTSIDAEDGRLTFFLGGRLPKGGSLEFAPGETCEVEPFSVGLRCDVGNIVLTDKSEKDRNLAQNARTPETKSFAPTYDPREYAGFKRWTLDDVKELNDFWFDLDTKRLYVYSETNPGERWASIEAALRDHCCTCHADDVIIENIAFTHTGSHGISLNSPKRVTIRNCDFDWIGGGDLYNQGGAGKRVRYGNGVEFWDGSEDCRVERCRFSRVYDVATTTQGPGDDVSKNLTISDCVMFRCEQAFEIWFTSPKTVVEGLVVEHNLFVDSGRGWSHVQRPDKTATPILGYGLEAGKVDITVRKNVFCDTAQFFVKCWHNRIADYTIDDNVYWVWDDSEERPHYSGDKYFCYDASHGKAPTTHEEFRAETGHDQNSRWLEPKFRDYAKDEFELTNRSELNAGPRK